MRTRTDASGAKICARRRSASPSTQAPAILVVHLKRFDHYGGKINSPVDFTERLTLGGHMSEDAEEAGAAYRLYAMVTHSGVSVSSGHYAFARKPTAPSEDDAGKNDENDAIASFYGAATNASDDEWYLCDDSSVQKGEPRGCFRRAGVRPLLRGETRRRRRPLTRRRP